MKNYQLNLTASHAPVKKAVDINRNFSAITSDSLGENIFDILKLRKIRTLKLTDCTIKKEQLASALLEMELLESLTFDCVKLDILSKEFEKPVELKHLKRLELIMSVNSFVGLLSTTSLECVSINGQSSLYYDAHLPRIMCQLDCNYILELLKLQPALKTLYIASGVVEDMINGLTSGSNKFPFKLRCLEIRKTDLKNFHEQISDLLKIHQDSLQELSLECVISQSTYQFVLQYMTGLKSLKIAYPPKIPIFDFEPMTNIRSLQSFGSLKSTEHLFKVFPSLDTLDLRNARYWSDHHLATLAEKYPRLQTLKMPNMTANDVKFVNLKYYYISQVLSCEESAFNSFIRRHAATLETLVIGWISGDDFARSLIIDAIKACEKLKHVQIESDSPMVTRMFKKVTRDHSWILESNLRARVGNSVKFFKVVFNFPDDTAVFLENCTTWDDQLIRDFSTVENYGLNAFINKFK